MTEFAGDRLGHFGRHRAQRIAQGQAGLDAANDEIDRVRKMLDEFFQTLLAHARQQEARQAEAADDADHHRHDRTLPERQGHESGEEAEGGRENDEHAGRDGHAALSQRLTEIRLGPIAVASLGPCLHLAQGILQVLAPFGLLLNPVANGRHIRLCLLVARDGGLARRDLLGGRELRLKQSEGDAARRDGRKKDEEQDTERAHQKLSCSLWTLLRSSAAARRRSSP